MPTHIHMITYNKETTSLSNIMRDFKHYTSSQIALLLERDRKTNLLTILKNAAEKRIKKQTVKIWKDEFHPIALKSETWFRQKLDYLHYNPVRKGFVEKPEHWKYSSARNWIHDDHSIIQIDYEMMY